jgi:transcriptional regulator with XRE-family HTH domain
MSGEQVPPRDLDIREQLWLLASEEVDRMRITPYAIAKRARVSPSVVSRWLRGERDLTLATAAKIARVLGLQIVRIDTAAGAEEADFAI